MGVASTENRELVNKFVSALEKDETFTIGQVRAMLVVAVKNMMTSEIEVLLEEVGMDRFDL